ncbi:MAG TPA: SRPBCC family protein [Gemmatimonadales bacterium]
MTKAGTLQVTTPSEREIRMTRTFDAPREAVYEALTNPSLVRRWLGALEGWTFEICEIDARIGGSYRYLWRHADGSELGMRGTYLDVVRPERIVSTEVFDQAWYEGHAVGTAVLTERDGRTTLTTTIRYDSKAIRDAVLRSPMESGVAQGYDRLEELLAAQAA